MKKMNRIFAHLVHQGFGNPQCIYYGRSTNPPPNVPLSETMV